MKVKKMSSKLIKPLTPTPPNLRNYNISLIDSRQLPKNMGFLLFYKSMPESYRRLEESLAQTLVQFFPLAGRFIKEHKSIDCSDQGAEFVEAEALGVNLVSKIGTDNLKDLNDLLPDRYFVADESATSPLLVIQATRFACGGMTLAVSISHRVFDASSLDTFIAAWSGATNPDDKTAVSIIAPSFDLPSLLPVKDDDSIVSANPSTAIDDDSIFIKKICFDKVTLASLRSKIGRPVSGARMACAVIAKALIRLGGGRRCSRIFQSVNMRGRTATPISKNACGNFSFISLSRRVEAGAEAETVGIPELVDLIGEAVRNCIRDCGDRDGRDVFIDGWDKTMEAYMDPDTKLIFFTDCSKFGFYEADFGWGKPAWTSVGPKKPRSNFTVVMSNREGDGIEAWLHLNDMDWSFNRDGEVIDQIVSQIIHNFLSV